MVTHTYNLTGEVAEAFLEDPNGQVEGLGAAWENWVDAVDSTQTLLGYWEWVQQQVDAQANEEMHTTNYPTQC